MEKLKIFAYLALISYILIFPEVDCLGVSQPILEEKTLLRGDSTRFYFEIQAVGSNVKHECVYSVSGLEPLQVTFEKDKVFIDPGQIKKVYGIISVPQDAPIKSYKGNLRVSCEPYVELKASGSLVKQTLNVPFTVNLAETIERRVIQKLPERGEEQPISPSTALALIIIIVLICGAYYWFRKRK